MGHRVRHLGLELKYHSPFTALGSLIGVMVAVTLTSPFPAAQMHEIGENVFHILHPIHILLSSLTTTAVLWKHRRRVYEALLVGTIGSIGPCSVSDILIPYMGSWLVVGGQNVEFHPCLLFHPQIVLIPAFIGVVAGMFLAALMRNSSLFSHGGHVLISVMASVFYLVGFGSFSLAEYLPAMCIIVFVAVLLPCCSSDIVIPTMFVGEVLEVNPTTAHSLHSLIRREDKTLKQLKNV